ncbi:MAG TPA: IS1595 family transposase [Burkholderiales bacterium]|nr:IS1595 family transposase [Burkholderiales bacterium]
MRPHRKVQNESTKNDPVIESLPLACANEEAAVEFMEKQRWGDHPACPFCGSLAVYKMMDSKEPSKRQANFRWRCKEKECHAQFTVRVGTVFEESRIPLKHWAFAFWRAATSKKGISALEIHRQTGVSYKSALFMLHRIRHAMDETDIEPLNGIVEVDEVYIGGKPRRIHGTRFTDAKTKDRKTPVIGMIERGGRVRPKVLADVNAENLKAAINANIARGSRIMTDDLPSYRGLKRDGWQHEFVKHSMYEFVRGDVTTNAIEGFFGLMKRGINGIYHSVSKKHLHRYLSEYQFRFNNRDLTDGERAVAAIKAAQGKRLTYAQQVGND